MVDFLHELYTNLKAALPPPEKLICGQKYFAVTSSNGNLGVCANLKQPSSIAMQALYQPDFSNYYHRIAVNAWINSHVNYKHTYPEEIDIFEKISFKEYRSIVMIGFFESLANKFNENRIPITVFDLESTSERITPIEKQQEALSKADIVITTSTTLANNTLPQIISWKSNNCKLLMLGPSTPLSSELAAAINAEYLFGAVFEPSPSAILEMIKNGAGTKAFLPYMKKVYLATKK